VVLTNESLMYFRNNKDKVPRDTISFSTRNDITIERTVGKSTAMDIYTVSNASTMKNRARISMMAESEAEMMSWMNLLKASAGVESQPLRTSSDVHTVSPTLRHALFGLTNSNKDTVLHLLSRSVGGGDQADSLLTASWLINNGCPVGTFNHKGLTPLHLAIQSGNNVLATYLAGRGANPNTTVSGAVGSRTSVDMAASHEMQLQLKKAYSLFESTVGSFLAAPPRLRGFHYLSIIFHRHTIASKT
jgi:hypothetical protein